MEFSSHEDTPTSLAPYEILYDDVDGKSDVVGIELVQANSVPSNVYTPDGSFVSMGSYPWG